MLFFGAGIFVDDVEAARLVAAEISGTSAKSRRAPKQANSALRNSSNG